MKNTLLDMIILYVTAIKNNDVITSEHNGEKLTLHNADYLLNQTIRQIGLPESHYLISKSAKEKWEEITDEPIEKYFYREKVTCKKDGPVTVDLYRGNESKSYATPELRKNDFFIYREVFSNEHMIPVKMIIDELLTLEELNYENILKTLNLIYICRLLKKEDKSIKRKVKRSLDIKEVRKIDYEEIDIVNFD